MPTHRALVPRRRCLSLLIAAPLLPACALLPDPEGLRLEEDQLGRSLVRRFPSSLRVLQVIDLRFDAPVLGLLPDRNRVALQVQAHARDRLVGQVFEATLGFDARLRWQANDLTLRLAEVQVDRLALRRAVPAAADGSPPLQALQAQPLSAQSLTAQARSEGQSTLERLAGRVAQEALEGLEVHRLTDAQQQQLRAHGRQVVGVSVVPGAVRVQLAPLR